jgi:hypothetical protein
MKGSASFNNVPHRPSTRKQKSAIKPTGQTRRTFLKQSAGAGIAAFGVSAWAATDVDGWEDKSEVKPMSFKAKLDEVLDLALAKLLYQLELQGINYCTSPTGHPTSRGELRAALGMTNEPDIEHELTQTISWKERTLGGYCTGPQYKKLQWEYSGNKFLRWNEYPTGVADYHPNPTEVWGYILYIEGYSTEDLMCLGDTDNANECVKGTDRTPSQTGGGKTWACVSGAEESLDPTDYKMTGGTFAADNSTQPKKVITDSDRIAEKFIVKHSTLEVAFDFKFHIPVILQNGETDKIEIAVSYSPWGFNPWPVEVKRPEEE